MQDNKKEHILPCYSVPDLEKASRIWREKVKVGCQKENFFFSSGNNFVQAESLCKNNSIYNV